LSVAIAPQRETHSAQYVEMRSDVVMPAANVCAPWAVMLPLEKQSTSAC